MKRFRNLLIASLVFLGLCLPACTPAEQPKQLAGSVKVVLTAPVTARVGELVRLDASGSDATAFKWLVVPETVDFEMYDNGKKAVFSARGPGDFLFVLAVAKEGEVDLVTHKIHIVGPPIAPPDATASVGEWVSFWLWDLQVTPESKVKLADNFDRIANMNLTEARDWIYETQKSNRDVLGGEITAWEPFLKNLGGLLGTLADEGKLATPEDHARVWSEIAAALRKG